MELSNYILINRDNTLYKAPISSLSSLIVTNSISSDFDDYLNKLSTSVDELTVLVEDIFCKKDDMKDKYATKENISEITNNGTYVLTDDAINEVKKLKTISEIGLLSNSWYQIQSHNSVSAICFAYEASKVIMKGPDKYSDKAKPEDYMVTPSYDDIMQKKKNWEDTLKK